MAKQVQKSTAKVTPKKVMMVKKTPKPAPMKKAPAINILKKDAMKNRIAKEDSVKSAHINKNISKISEGYKKADSVFRNRPYGYASTPAANNAWKKAKEQADSLKKDNSKIYKTMVNKPEDYKGQKEDQRVLKMYDDVRKSKKK